MITIRFGKEFMCDLEHKMTILSDEPDLQEDYKLTQEQCESFRAAISHANARKIREIQIPDYMVPAVIGEMENMRDIVLGNESGEGNKVFLQAHAIEKQIDRLQSLLPH